MVGPRNRGRLKVRFINPYLHTTRPTLCAPRTVADGGGKRRKGKGIQVKNQCDSSKSRVVTWVYSAYQGLEEYHDGSCWTNPRPWSVRAKLLLPGLAREPAGLWYYQVNTVGHLHMRCWQLLRAGTCSSGPLGTDGNKCEPNFQDHL